MSKKMQQMLEYVVNEDKEKAEELFHQIVVEMSREIYENLIAEEEDEEMDEAKEEDDEEEMDESKEEDDEEEMDESMDLEDSYSMEAGHDDGDATDDFGSEVEMGDEEGEMGDEEGPEAGEDKAIFDIKNAIAELEAAFAELEQAQGGEEHHGGFGDEEEMGDEEGEEDEDEGMQMGQPAFEGRRMTREYVEKVGNDWEKNSQKTQGQYAGAGTGDKDGSPVEGRSPISSAKGKITSTANAGNIAKSATGEGNNTGTSPNKVNKGITPEKGDKFASINGNVPGGKMGVKNLSKVAGGHGAEKKGSGPGPVGSGTGDKAGQTSVGQVKSPINGAPNRNA